MCGGEKESLGTEKSRDVRDNENRVMYNDRESVTLLQGDVERPCL